jgi:hypothetical protein
MGADSVLTLIGLADPFGGAAVKSGRQLSYDRTGPYRSGADANALSIKLLMDKAIGANARAERVAGWRGWRSIRCRSDCCPRSSTTSRCCPSRGAAGLIPAHFAKVYAVDTL